MTFLKLIRVLFVIAAAGLVFFGWLLFTLAAWLTRVGRWFLNAGAFGFGDNP